jgi:hypothetical protein
MSGVQPHTFGVPPPPHVSGMVHEPQPIILPQPSPTLSQFFPSCWHVFAVHPHTFETPPPPHVSYMFAHVVEHMTSPPHPSLTVPQRFVHVVSGVHGVIVHLPLLQ